MSTDTELRIPTQARGTKRVESILDAAAALVMEVGVEGVTAQVLADRAATSKGSLYHFFPDIPSVLRALADRHLEEIGAIMETRRSDASLRWGAMSPAEVVSHVLAPLDYLERNCDLLALVRAPGVMPRSARSMQPMVDYVDFVLGARFPEMDAERRAARASTLVSVIDGIVGSSARGCARGSRGMRRELEELLTVYVGSLG